MITVMAWWKDLVELPSLIELFVTTKILHYTFSQDELVHVNDIQIPNNSETYIFI